jgi:pectate lyase
MAGVGGATAGSASGGSAGAVGGSASGGSAGATGGAGGTGGKGGTSGSGPTGGTAGAAGSGSGVFGKAIGFATLNGGTTGGLGGQTVTATTYTQLKMYAESTTAYVIMVEGTISNGADGGRINVRANKSIVGVGSTAFLNGIGLNISSQNNIILQNLRISLTGVTTRTEKADVYTTSNDEGRPAILVNDGDAIGIQGTSRNIWIDHCEIFAENPDTQTNIDLYDGLIDIKNQTGFITISWNYLHDQHKGGLVGSSDSDTYADRKITYHHNYYNKVKLRVPMYRGAVGHFFNNYILAANDASEIRAGTCVRIEKNYYEPLHYSIYTSSDSAGSTERIDNVEVMRTSRAYPANCTADIPYSYSAVLTNTTADVKTLVPQGAGVGKI